MAVPDKVEAVSKASETSMNQQLKSVEDADRVAPNKDHFDSLMNSTQSMKMPTPPERIDKTYANSEDIQRIEDKPVIGDDNVTAQKSDSSDQQQRRQNQQGGGGDDAIAEVSGPSRSQKSSRSSSLMDEVANSSKNSSISNLNPNSIKAEAKNAISQIEQVKNQLSQTQTEIKPSYNTLLRNRLTHVDDNLKIALSKAGVEHPSPSPQVNSSEGAHGVHRFINLLSNSQNQLEVLVNQLGAHEGRLSPADMLTIQIKVGYVQQQIELFTNLLNKALESTKTIMNVQV